MNEEPGKVATMASSIERMNKQVRLWRAQIAELTTQAEVAEFGAGFRLRQKIDDLKSRCALTQSKIDRIA